MLSPITIPPALIHIPTKSRDVTDSAGSEYPAVKKGAPKGKWSDDGSAENLAHREKKMAQ
jgi:hypothetical protein